MNHAGLEAMTARWSASRLGRLQRKSGDLELGMHSLALAAQHVLCAAPFLVAMSALARAWGIGDVAFLLSDTMGLRGDAQHDLMQLFRARSHDEAGAFVVGFLIAFGFATGVSATMQRTFERIWRLPHAGVWGWWRHIAWALATTVLFGFAMWVNRATHRWDISTPSEIAVESASTGIGAFFYYWWTQRVLLCGRVKWRHLLPGAALIAVGTTMLIVGVQVLAPSQITSQVADYGLVGAAFILSTILVTFSTIILWGVYLGRELARSRVEAAFDSADDLDPADALLLEPTGTP